MDYGKALAATGFFGIRASAVWWLWAAICPALHSPAKEGALLVGMLVAVEFLWNLGMTAILGAREGGR